MELGSSWPWLAGVILILSIVNYLTSRYYKLLSIIPASKCPRFIGHALDFCRHPDEILSMMTKIFEAPTSNRNVLAIWAGPMAFVYLRDLKDIEKLLTSSANIRKSVNYSFLKPWLGQGLINSEGETWQFHRKLITPSFHFKILEVFLETMSNKAEILSSILDEKVGEGCFNIEPYIANYSLDIITETAMSSSIDAQYKKSNFVDCIKSLTEIIIIRSVRIWYHFSFLFYLSSYGWVEKKSISYVNNFIKSIMDSKRNDKAANKEQSKKEEPSDIGAKKKLALLDLLFEVQSKNPKFTDKEILDEVNTFMFAGHDTTTSGISFVLYLLSVHQDVQERVFNELLDTFGDRKPTYQDLMGLKYLERVIKESLRLYPSVPYIGRRLKEDLQISTGHTLPEFCDTAIFIYNHHRNPENWSDPEKFDPDRFLAENSEGRHPYAYIPFSAGSRNCIGQKFAMLEIMLTVSHLLRRFKLIIEPGFIVHPISHIVLRPDEKGIRLKLERR